MTKVLIDYSSYQNNGSASMDEAIAILDDVLDYLQATSVPNDFNRRNTLVGVINNFKKYRNDLKYYKNWLADSNKNYNSMIDKLESQANKLPVYNIRTRNDIVR